MSAGPEPDVLSDDVFVSRFPIHRACRDGDVGDLVSLLQRLSNQAHLTAEDSCYGWTPMHWAAHYGQLNCVMRLVQMGCEVNTVSSRLKQTPAHSAAFGGHPHCVVWLTQAGADVNWQDFLGEAPIHKAARSGSLECVQVLLIAGAKPSLRNTSGQTAADLAHANGFHDCFCLISRSQLSGSPANGALSGNGAPCGQGPQGRKRLLTAEDASNGKKARRAEDVLARTSGGEEPESMNIEDALELNSVAANGHHHTPHLPGSLSSPAPPAADRQAVAPARRPSADMCGSLHLTASPGSYASRRPAWWGPGGGDSLLYGHYHGFGDTAEELGEGSGRVEHR